MISMTAIIKAERETCGKVSLDINGKIQHTEHLVTTTCNTKA